MLKPFKKLNRKGFTIIEVMIVLAIAGLILLIVFLAVPALERAARNTQRKNDVSNILAEYNNATTDNNGIPPTCVGYTAPNLNMYSTTGTPCTGQLESTKLGYYTAGVPTAGGTEAQAQVQITTFTAAAGKGGTIPGLGGGTPAQADDYVLVIVGGTCDPTTRGQVDSGTPTEVAIQYELEAGNNNYSDQCQDS